MSAYDLSIYDQKAKLAPVALTAGEAPYGGDVGFELGFAFAFTSYAIVRRFELKYFGR